MVKILRSPELTKMPQSVRNGPRKPRTIAPMTERDYNGYMIKTLRESKAMLSELVEVASKGEEVLITVRGKVKARLVAAEKRQPLKDGPVWAGELRNLQRAHSVRRVKTRTEDILSDLRKDRL
jgi:prevent-host-death family protein